MSNKVIVYVKCVITYPFQIILLFLSNGVIILGDDSLPEESLCEPTLYAGLCVSKHRSKVGNVIGNHILYFP